MIDAAGVALIITAVAALIGAVASAYVTVRTSNTVKATHALVVAVDRAVNGKAPGEQTMVSQVDDLHREIPEHDKDEGDAG